MADTTTQQANAVVLCDELTDSDLTGSPTGQAQYLKLYNGAVDSNTKFLFSNADFDTTGSTALQSIFGIALPSASGAVIGGTATNPFRVDPTGTTTQPVSISGTLPVTQSGTWNVGLTDAGTINAAAPTKALPAGMTDGTNLQMLRGYDLNLNAPDTEFVLGVSLRGSSYGNSVELGSTSNPIIVDTATRNNDSTITALNGDVSISTFWGRGNFVVQITNTFAGTLVFEASMDGSTYVALSAINIGTNSVVTSTTGTGTFLVNCTGFYTVRVRASAWTSGTATVKTGAAVGTGAVYVLNAAAGGSGTQYTEGDTDASITGTAMMWEDTGDTLRAVSAAKPLPISDAGGSITVDGTVAATQSGTWNINNVSGTVSLPTGAATETTLAALNTKVTACNTGAVTISAALPAGTNNIGDVDVLSLPALPAGANVIGGVTQSGSWTVQPGNTANTTPWLVDAPKASSASGVTPVTVSTTSTAIIASNSSRKEVVIQNNSTSVVYIALGGTPTAAGNYHVALKAANAGDDGSGGSFSTRTFTGAINGIVAAGTAKVTVVEV